MKYQDGQVTSYSSQVIDLEANNHKLPMEDIPLSTYATAQAQPCDTPWPGSTQEQTESQEQAKAVAPRPGPAYRRTSCCEIWAKIFLFTIGFAFLCFLFYGGVWLSYSAIVGKG